MTKQILISVVTVVLVLGLVMVVNKSRAKKGKPSILA